MIKNKKKLTNFKNFIEFSNISDPYEVLMRLYDFVKRPKSKRLDLNPSSLDPPREGGGGYPRWGRLSLLSSRGWDPPMGSFKPTFL